MKWVGIGLTVLFLAVMFPSAAGPSAAQAALGRQPGQLDSSGFPPAEAVKTRRAVEAARRSLDFQTELPAPSFSDRNRRSSPFFSGLWDFLISPEAARVLLWLAIALAVGAILWTMRDMWGRTAALNPADDVQDDENSAQAAARMSQARVGADDLARRGDYIGAMHLLLLQSVGELRSRLKTPIAASLTSREIWFRTSLPPEGKKAFSDIIGRVEISWFGRHQPGAEDYLACRRSFETLTSVLKRAAEGPARPGPAPSSPEPGPAS